MDDKKAAIIEQASKVFLKFGIKSVTMDDMARELGVSKKTLYVHFKDKKDLVYQIICGKIQHDQVCCMGIKNEAENAIDELFKVSAYVSEMMSDIHPSVFYDIRKFHPKSWEILHAHKWEFVKKMILENIQRGKKEGLYRKELIEEIIAAVYVTSTDLISDGDVFRESTYNSDELFQEIFRFQIFGMANEKGLAYLNERNKSRSHE